MSADLVPVVEASDIERAADPAEFVVQTLERAKTWLSTALEHGELERIAELRSQAEAMRIYVMSKQLGKDAELSAAEIVRRAERGIGVCIRRGQREGTVRVPSQHGAVLAENRLVSPKDYIGTGGQTMSDTYAMTDNVDDELFEAAVTSARATGSMSRRGLIRRIHAERIARTEHTELARKTWDDAWHGDEPEPVATSPTADTDDELWVPLRNANNQAATDQRRKLITHYAGLGYTSPQIADVTGLIPETVRRIARETAVSIVADVAMGRGTRKGIDSNRIVRETASTLDGLVTGVGLVDVEALDPAEIDDWVRSLSTSIRALNRLIKQMKEKTQ